VYKVKSIPQDAVEHALRTFLNEDDYNDTVNNYRRSEISEEKLIEDFFSYEQPQIHLIKDDCYEFALQYVKKVFQPPEQYRPVHFTDLRRYEWELSTSVEEPFASDKHLQREVRAAFERGDLENNRMTLHNLYNHVFVKNRQHVHEIKMGNFRGDHYYYEFKAHARSHLVQASDEDKVRLVYGVPKLLLMIELMLLWPLIEWFKLGETPIAWGYETLNGGFYKMRADMSHKHIHPVTTICLDWKFFDKRALFQIIDDIHDIWRSYQRQDQYMPTPVYNEELQNSNISSPDKINNLWKWMNNALKHSPLRLPDGSLWKRKRNGIPSGLLQTQILDSFVNLIMIVTTLAEMGIYVDETFYIKVLGDDSYITFPFEIPDPESFKSRFKEIALRRFNAFLNERKSVIVRGLNGAHFLGYVDNNGIPTRPRCALLAQLLYPERVVNIDTLAARATGIAWASCGQDVTVYRICKDVYDYAIRQGATPRASGFWMTQVYPDISFEEFPTRSEILRRLKGASGPPSNWDNWFLARY